MLESPADVITVTPNYEPVRKAYYKLELVNSRGNNMPESSKYHIQSIGDLVDDIKTEPYAPYNGDFEIPVGKATTQLPIIVRFFRDNAVYKFFKDWKRLVYNPDTDQFGLYSDIVGSGIIKLYGPSAEKASGSQILNPPIDPLYEIRLNDVYPKSLVISGLDSEDDGSSPATWQVTLSVGSVTN